MTRRDAAKAAFYGSLPELDEVLRGTYELDDQTHQSNGATLAEYIERCEALDDETFDVCTAVA